MNLLLLDADEIGDDGRVHLDDRRAEHLRNILRVTPGRTVRAGIVRGHRLDATVVAVERRAVTLTVTTTPETTPSVSRPPVSLIVALPRPQVLHRVLQFAAAMTVERIDLIAAWRVEKSFFSSPSLRPETIERHLRLGAEQGATTLIPEVALHQRFRDFVDNLPVTGDTLRLLAHLDQTQPIEQAWQPIWTPLPCVWAIGPEGGWIDREVDTWRDLGFTPVGLGPWVLRVEAAVISALSQLDLLRRKGEPPTPVC